MIKTLFMGLFECHVHQVGCQRLETQHYVETIGGIYVEYKKIIGDNFNTDPDLLAALNAVSFK